MPANPALDEFPRFHYNDAATHRGELEDALLRSGFVAITGVVGETRSSSSYPKGGRAGEGETRSGGSYPIFNETGRGVPDGLRRQIDIQRDGALVLRGPPPPTWLRGVVDRIKTLAGRLGRRADTISGLVSLAGCTEQPPHYDFNPASLEGATPGLVPLSLIVATEAGTSLVALLRDDGTPRQVCIAAGDGMLFRGDSVHAGSAYHEHNFRIHAYLDTPEFPANAAKTFLSRSARRDGPDRVAEERTFDRAAKRRAVARV